LQHQPAPVLQDATLQRTDQAKDQQHPYTIAQAKGAHAWQNGEKSGEFWAKKMWSKHVRKNGGFLLQPSGGFNL
jgi:hypothetical protein